MQKEAPQSRNAAYKRLRRNSSHNRVRASGFADHTFPIGLRAALFDAMIGQCLYVVIGLHSYSLVEALTD